VIMGDGKRGPTVKTTIVGGQPPGNERAPGGIPVGVEELLSMAAVEPEFAQALMERPEETIQASGVALTESEQAILKSVGPGNLAAMIDGVRGVMPDEQRRDFLGRSAAAVLLLASGVGSGAAACDWGMRPPAAGPTRWSTSTRLPRAPGPIRRTLRRRPNRTCTEAPSRPAAGPTRRRPRRR